MPISIDYIELAATDIAATKAFYSALFCWTFTDWGDTYISFEGAGIDGGFDGTRKPAGQAGTMVVLKHEDLESLVDQVREFGGKVTAEIFAFPGGERFQFLDPNGNEIAVFRERSMSAAAPDNFGD